MKVELIIPCSPEQTEIIEDHLLEGRELGLQPDERAWMLAQARKKYPTCKILGAMLYVADAEWNLTLDVPNVTERDSSVA